jgi:hypothetical protein
MNKNAEEFGIGAILHLMLCVKVLGDEKVSFEHYASSICTLLNGLYKNHQKIVQEQL